MENRRGAQLISDVLLLSIPRIAPVRPQAAMGVLKALCNQEHRTSRTLDLNHDFFMRLTPEHPGAAKEIDDYFVSNCEQLSEDTALIYRSWLQKCVDRVLAHESRLLVMSVFSWQSQKFAEDFLRLLRPIWPHEILVGGQGLENSQNMSSHWTPRAQFAEKLLSEKLIDWYLKGESEETFPRFLRGERNIPGLNRNDVVMLHDLDKMPISDFGDFVIDSYQNGFDGGVLPIESCRGCVRACVFCEMSGEHGGYRRKDGRKLGQELIHYYETYGVRHYYFHDDLINGNLKDFHAFMDTLIAYYQKKSLPDRWFTFSGYWIIRNPKQFDETSFQKLYRAGGNTLVTGVETGSDRLRKIMRKGFVNKDLEFNLDQISRHRMKFYFMLISGLPGETPQDFQHTLDALTRWQRYVATGAIIGINLGTTATIEPGTYIYNHADQFHLEGLKGQRPSGINWMSRQTPELDYRERVRRRVKLQEHVMALGYPIWKGDDHLKIIMDRYRQHLELWEA